MLDEYKYMFAGSSGDIRSGPRIKVGAVVLLILALLRSYHRVVCWLCTILRFPTWCDRNSLLKRPIFWLAEHWVPMSHNPEHWVPHVSQKVKSTGNLRWIGAIWFWQLVCQFVIWVSFWKAAHFSAMWLLTSFSLELICEAKYLKSSTIEIYCPSIFRCSFRLADWSKHICLKDVDLKTDLYFSASSCCCTRSWVDSKSAMSPRKSRSLTLMVFGRNIDRVLRMLLLVFVTILVSLTF